MKSEEDGVGDEYGSDWWELCKSALNISHHESYPTNIPLYKTHDTSYTREACLPSWG